MKKNRKKQHRRNQQKSWEELQEMFHLEEKEFTEEEIAMLEKSKILMNKQREAMRKDINNEKLTEEETNILKELAFRMTELRLTIAAAQKSLNGEEPTEEEKKLIVKFMKKLKIIGVPLSGILVHDLNTYNPFHLGAEHVPLPIIDTRQIQMLTPSLVTLEV